MIILLAILLSTFIVSLIAFTGILFLFLKENLLNKLFLILVAFSAGALLGSAFFHLIPESISKMNLGAGFDEKSILNIFLYVVLGFCSFFILEQFINWHHHHAKAHPEVTSFSYLILISDAVHNFIDGLTIAASFLVAFPLGVTATIAIILHEIPQEISNFGVLVYGGFKKIKALFLNFLSAIAAVFGGIIGFWLGESIGQSIIFLLPLAAGNFIYIASSDLIPEIKNRENFQKSLIHFFVFLLGIGLMWVLKVI